MKCLRFIYDKRHEAFGLIPKESHHIPISFHEVRSFQLGKIDMSFKWFVFIAVWNKKILKRSSLCINHNLIHKISYLTVANVPLFGMSVYFTGDILETDSRMAPSPTTMNRTFPWTSLRSLMKSRAVARDDVLMRAWGVLDKILNMQKLNDYIYWHNSFRVAVPGPPMRHKWMLLCPY